MPSDPLAYFITFHTYGTWLHGSKAGSVDRTHNAFGETFIPPAQVLAEDSRHRMRRGNVALDAVMRWIVHHELERTCTLRNWTLHAQHVRTNHVHLVVTATDTPVERVMNSIKSWCTRRLVEHGLHEQGQPAWVRHGSTQYLWREPDVHSAIDYVLRKQGRPLPMHPPESQA